MAYDIGEKVMVVCREAAENLNRNFGDGYFPEELMEFCGKTVTIKDVFVFDAVEDYAEYVLEEVPSKVVSCEMISAIPQYATILNNYCMVISGEKLGYPGRINVTLDGYEYEIDKNGLISFVRKVPLKKYPKTFKDCCELLGVCEDGYLSYGGIPENRDHNSTETGILNDLECLRKLLICRNAYWEVYGKWDPMKWEGVHYYIYGDGEKIEYGVVPFKSDNRILDFPDQDVRREFANNFGPIISECVKFI